MIKIVTIADNEELIVCPECSFKFVKKMSVKTLFCPMCECRAFNKDFEGF